MCAGTVANKDEGHFVWVVLSFDIELVVAVG